MSGKGDTPGIKQTEEVSGMTTRREFLRRGALWVAAAAVVEPVARKLWAFPTNPLSSDSYLVVWNAHAPRILSVEEWANQARVLSDKEYLARLLPATLVVPISWTECIRRIEHDMRAIEARPT